MTNRSIRRYEVPIDRSFHVHPLTHSPVAVAARRDFVEFWCEHTEEASPAWRAFQVFGTGATLPDDAKWIGTCARTPKEQVWHLYEIPYYPEEESDW